MFIKTRFLSSLIATLCISLVVTCSCTTKSYTTDDSGITVRIKGAENGDAQLVRLEVFSDEIIRVISTPEKSLSQRESLIVEKPQGEKASFVIVKGDSAIQLVTQKVIATVSLEDGNVSFLDAENKLILREDPGHKKHFEAIEADGFSGYSFQQVFESPADEALFGLGQHQSDEWNYKGKNEELFQYNTKVSVPFIVSNYNYGILWDNYSLTRFGNKEDYSQLSQFRLYDKQGEEGALTATYITEQDEIFIERRENEIDYEHLDCLNKFPEDFPFNNAQINWQGFIEAPESGLYHFKLYYAGYTRVELDGKEVVAERWRTAWNPNTYKFTVLLEAGKKVPLKLQWKPDGGVSYIGLKALSPRPDVEQEKLALWSEMGQEMDYYFIHGESIDEVIGGYRALTGKATILPRWAYGFWQSRERYKTQEEITEALAEFRNRKIPIDNIVLDWSYWEEDQWGSHEFEAERFPDPKKMLDDLHEMNAHVMISVWPKFYINTDNYRELDEKGWMYQKAVKDSVRDWIGKGYIGSFYDPYSEEARKLFWEQMRENIYTLGIDAWWMDASEPDILSNSSLAYRKQLSTPTAMGSSTEFLNTYALMNAEGIYEGQRGVDPNKRIFLLTRSGFAGLQRYGTATWSGDIGTRWEDMKAQITAGMNFALSGIPYWTMDIGGFCVEKRYERATEGSEDLAEWRELNTRWYQFGAFAPLFRAHGQYPYREVYNIAPDNHPAYQSILWYNKLRYRLMPYIYSLAGKIYFDDYTLMRGLVMDFPKDPDAIMVDNQFMFGPALMVCPVTEYMARERQVYLPKGPGWYDAYSGNMLEGGQVITADAPYQRMPLYVKAGSILPIGPEIEYTGQKPDAPITLIIYTGSDGTFELYEDEGLNYNYESGAYTKIPIRWSEEQGRLYIGERSGAFEGMQEECSFRLVFVSPAKPAGFKFDSLEHLEINYNGSAIELVPE